MNITERFMAKVSVDSMEGCLTESDRCWNWTGAKAGSGYGQFWNGDRNIPAHWFLLGEFPTNGMQACHHCDNKLCVRPSHIFIGTRSDNERDKVSKGRHNTAPGCRAMLAKRRTRKGAELPQSRITEEQARRIKSAPAKYGILESLAREHGISKAAVSDIRGGRTWKHV